MSKKNFKVMVDLQHYKIATQLCNGWRVESTHQTPLYIISNIYSTIKFHPHQYSISEAFNDIWQHLPMNIGKKYHKWVWQKSCNTLSSVSFFNDFEIVKDFISYANIEILQLFGRVLRTALFLVILSYKSAQNCEFFKIRFIF